MMFDSPHLWWLLGLLPLIGLALLRGERQRRAQAQRFAELVMLPRLMPAATRERTWIKATAVLLGLSLLIAAALRPRWGEYYEDVLTHGADLFVLLDVSRSMLATDVAPNRLERAKSDIRDLLSRLGGDRVGLIAFAGAATVSVPLTTDRGFFLTALEEVGTESAPRGGSLIGDAIRKALEAMQERADRDQVLVLITDGEDHDSFPREAAQQAAARGVKVICVGLGDPDQGTRIPMQDQAGHRTYLSHEGQEIWSKLDEDLLKEISVTTQGAYVPARTSAYDLGQVYEQHLAGLTRADVSTERRKRYRERFQWLLALGLGVLLLEGVIPRYPRVRETQDA